VVPWFPSLGSSRSGGEPLVGLERAKSTADAFPRKAGVYALELLPRQWAGRRLPVVCSRVRFPPVPFREALWAAAIIGCT
jgi:hypothetical protein